jgi:hypothetical protein
MPSDGKSSHGLWPGELKMGMVPHEKGTERHLKKGGWFAL